MLRCCVVGLLLYCCGVVLVCVVVLRFYRAVVLWFNHFGVWGQAFRCFVGLMVSGFVVLLKCCFCLFACVAVLPCCVDVLLCCCDVVLRC